MFTLHTKKIKRNVVIPDIEFLKLIENYRRFEPIEVVEDDDPDFLTEDELREHDEAMKELERGETINFNDVKDRWLKGKPSDVCN
jgi:hypothetical protein